MAKVVFAGLARDCAQHLPAVLANLDRLAGTAAEAAFVFVENDSQDSTNAIVRRWGADRSNFTLFDLAGLGGIPIRTLRLEYARNVYLEFVRGEPALSDFDVLCVVDMDDVGARPLDVGQFQVALDYLSASPDRAAVFANQIGTYYDMWAFRHPEYCPEDVWFEVLESAHIHGGSDQEAFDRTFAPRVVSFDPAAPPFEVDSAFGGLGLYRLDWVRRAPNPYLGSRIRVLCGPGAQRSVLRMQQCEHVHFNQGLRLIGGRLAVMPGLVNGVRPNPADTRFPASAYRGMPF